MRITGNSQLYGRPGAGTARAAGSGASFQPQSGAAAARSAAPGAAIATTGIDALLALQGMDDATQGRRKAIRRGHALLDSLEDIQADLVIGRISEGRLNRAMALVQQAKTAGGEALDAVIADIELRVRVELAKLGRFPSF